MKILFVNHHHLDSNSGIHIFNLANCLAHLGIECVVCVPEQKDAVKALGLPLFEVVSIQDIRQKKDLGKIDLVHAWTPREIVRLMTRQIVAIYNCPYIVHLEDNEETLVSAAIGKPTSFLNQLSESQLDQVIAPHMSHPKRYKEFLNGASGISMIIDTLREFCPPDKPSEVIWPGYDGEINWALPTDEILKKQLGIASDERVVVYTGNVHSANYPEVFSLYLAVGLLNRRGITTRIIRTGENFVTFVDKPLESLIDHAINLGFVKRNELPVLLSLADVLVQPGKADQFNNYRFPSKLPEYFASGKPVLLPATNIGRYLKDGEECILLQEGHALEIARKLERLFSDDSLRQKIGDAGRCFAEKNLRWADSAVKLQTFYERLIASSGKDEFSGVPSQHEILDVRSSRAPNLTLEGKNPSEIQEPPIPIISYATVQDYCDSADCFSRVMRFDGDLKDVQRPWMLKSIVKMIPRGAKLLEIGAGEPLVADALQKHGYDVTIVDPYDGSGNGPRAYQKYLKEYPNIKIIKSYFNNNTPLLSPKTYDCIYSISVLEHVSHDDLGSVFSGILQFIKPSGYSIHCTDLVIAGYMADWHDRGAREILFWQYKLQNPWTDEHKIRMQVDKMVEEFYEKSAIDLETYYHSAQGHNLWRAGRPYEEHPFRKIISMQTCAVINFL